MAKGEFTKVSPKRLVRIAIAIAMQMSRLDET